jgi:hypothetical protein
MECKYIQIQIQMEIYFWQILEELWLEISLRWKQLVEFFNMYLQHKNRYFCFFWIVECPFSLL